MNESHIKEGSSSYTPLHITCMHQVNSLNTSLIREGEGDINTQMETVR